MKKSNFLKVKCPRCHNEQMLFSRASTRVKCQSCNILLLKTSGGKAKIMAAVKKVL